MRVAEVLRERRATKLREGQVEKSSCLYQHLWGDLLPTYRRFLVTSKQGSRDQYLWNAESICGVWGTRGGDAKLRHTRHGPNLQRGTKSGHQAYFSEEGAT